METFDAAEPVLRESILICFYGPGLTQEKPTGVLSAMVSTSQMIKLTLRTEVHTARGSVSEALTSALGNWGVTALKDTPWRMGAVEMLEDHFCNRQPWTTGCTRLQGLVTFSDLNNTCLG